MMRAELTNRIKPILYNAVAIDWPCPPELCEDTAAREVTFRFHSKKIQWTRWDAAKRQQIRRTGFLVPGMSQLGLFAVRFSTEQKQVQFYLLGKAVTCLKASSSYSSTRLRTSTKSVCWGFCFVTLYWHLKYMSICPPLKGWSNSSFHLCSIVETQVLRLGFVHLLSRVEQPQKLQATKFRDVEQALGQLG